MGSSGAGRGRVAVVSHGFFPTVGGSERYHLFGARAVSAFAEVEVFTSALNLSPDLRAGGVEPPPVPGVTRTHYLRSRWILNERFVGPTALWRALRRFRPSVVWSNHPSPTADLGAVYALLTGAVWVPTYHADVSLGRWRNRAYLHWEMWLLRRAWRVLVTSERYRETLARRGVRRDRIVVAPPGPYIGDGVLPAVGAALDLSHPRPFLFVGALDTGHEYKRVDLLLEAVATLAKEGLAVSLEVVGDGDRRVEMQGLAQRLGVADRVRFLGKLSDAELANRFAAAAALVLPAVTTAEGFGSVAVEAVQYGCPVVTSTQVALGESLASEGAALCFDAAHPETLAPILRQIHTNPATRAALSAGAYAAAPQFAWDRRMSPIVNVLREGLALAHSRGKAP